MGLSIDNQTDWDGRALYRLCRRVIKQTDGHMDRTVIIRTSRARDKEWRWENGMSGVYRGRASIGRRSYLYMGVPKIEREVNGEMRRAVFDPEQFARVLEHELAHHRGLRHGDMTEDLLYCKQELGYDVSDVEVEPKPTWSKATQA